MNLRPHILPIVIGSVVFAVSSTARSQDTDRKPLPMQSLAEPVSAKTLRSGPKFKNIEVMLKAAGRGDGAALGAALSSATAAKLSYFENSQLKSRSFDAELVNALQTSCLGPFSVDEGLSWVQLSWVCDEKPDAAIAKYLAFRETPELSVTIFFDGQKIKSIDAIEPLWFPGARRIPKGAYAAMKKNG